MLMEKPPYHGYYIVKIWEVQFSSVGRKQKAVFRTLRNLFLNTKLCKMPYGIWKN